MASELVLDASVSLAWFLKETPERAVYAAAVSAVAAEGAILHVPVQWGMEMGHVLLREHRFPLATLDYGHRQAAKVHNVMVFSPT